MLKLRRRFFVSRMKNLDRKSSFRFHICYDRVAVFPPDLYGRNGTTHPRSRISFCLCCARFLVYFSSQPCPSKILLEFYRADDVLQIVPSPHRPEIFPPDTSITESISFNRLILCPVFGTPASRISSSLRQVFLLSLVIFDTNSEQEMTSAR